LYPHRVMTRSIAIVTALHVLAHGIFGCCDHAWGAWSDTNRGQVCNHSATDREEAGHHGPHVAAIDCETKCDPAAARDKPEEQSAPDRGDGCCHSSCDWMKSNASPDLSQTPFGCGPVLFPLLIARIDPVSTPAYWPEADVGRFHALPLRLHLALGVLLI
jgi:hypothetical protein